MNQPNNHEELAKDWGRHSMAGHVCGYFGCLVPPERFCTCSMTYCNRHFPEHCDRYPAHEPDVALWEQEPA